MEKVRWGVLGTAGIARGATIPGMLQAENCELFAVAGRTLEKAVLFQEEFGFEKAYGSYEDLLADAMVQAIYIPLPNDLHKEWVIKALQAKKNVLCEKPLGASTAEVREMFACARQNGVLLEEAFAYLHSPFTQQVRQAVRDGRIGKIRYVQSTFITSDYDISNIRMRRETLGGALYDLGCYPISQILWFLEDYPSDIKACALLSDQHIDLLTAGVMGFDSGAKAQFTCGMVLNTEKNEQDSGFTLYGTEGVLSSRVPFNAQGDLSYSIRVAEGEESITVPARHNYALEIEQFSRCVLGTEKPLLDETFSLRNAQVIDAALASLGY